MSTKAYPSSLNVLDLQHNDIQQVDKQKESKSGNYNSNLTSLFTQNAVIGTDKKVAAEEKDDTKTLAEKLDNTTSIEKSDSHTVHVHTVYENSSVNENATMKANDKLQEVTVKSDLEQARAVKSYKKPPKLSPDVSKWSADNFDFDAEPIAFSEESLKVFETSGLSKEENKIIEALEDTISGFVNAAFDDGADPLDESRPVITQNNSDEDVFDSKSSSRSSSLSNTSGTDKPGIIVRTRDTSTKREKRPNSVSFRLPENHVDKQTSGQYNSRTLPGSARAQGYKRVLNFYSYRPNSSVWSTQDFMRHYSDDNLRAPPMPIMKGRGSVSKKSSGPFNATFREWLKGKPKTDASLQPVEKQVNAVRTESNTNINLPVHTKKRASILDKETTKLIPKLEMNAVYESTYKLSNQPYIVQESSPTIEEAHEKGDKFLY